MTRSFANSFRRHARLIYLFRAEYIFELYELLPFARPARCSLPLAPELELWLFGW
jgi:hypothetical protein